MFIIYSDIATKELVNSFFFTIRIYCEHQSFHIGMESSPLTRKFMRNIMIYIVTFLTPSFWMNLPSRVIHKPKTCLSRSLKVTNDLYPTHTDHAWAGHGGSGLDWLSVALHQPTLQLQPEG